MKLVSTNYFRNQYVDEIIDNFNWDRVHKVMDFLKWTYNDDRVPDIEELKTKGEILLKNIWLSTNEKKSEAWSIKSGGFKATAAYNHKKGRVDYLKLEFIIDDYYKEEE